MPTTNQIIDARNRVLFAAKAATNDAAKVSDLEGKIVVNNIPLVRCVIKRYHIFRNFIGSYEDAEQAGLVGLVEAIRRYDASKAAFSTYAYFWIRQALIRQSANRLIHVPVDVIQDLGTNKPRKRTIGRLKCGERSLNGGVLFFGACQKPGEFMDFENHPSHEYTPVDSPHNTIADRHDGLQKKINREHAQTTIKKMMEHLGQPARQIVEMRYGLTGPVKSLKEISQVFNTTRQNIQYHLSHSFRKLAKEFQGANI